MIQEETILKVADNSGAKTVQCIRILGGTRKKYAQLGDIIVVAVKKAEPRKTVQKHNVEKAVVVRQRKAYRRKDGSYIRFDDNAVVIIESKDKIKSTRILGPIAREIKEKGFTVISNLVSDLV